MSYLDPNIVTNKVGTPALVSPQGGMLYPLRANADPTGKMVTGAATLLSLPSAGYTSTLPPATTFSTMYITNAAWDVTLTSFTGGTSPTITFLFDRQGADGNWYPIMPASGTGAAVLSAGTLSMSMDIGLLPPSVTGGSGVSIYGAAHNVFTPVSRVRWTLAGSPAAGTATFSMSVIGR